jgi:site-specific recombinase XerD
MAINFFVDKGSIYAIFRKQKDGRRINLTYYPGIPAGNEWNADRQRFNPKTEELEKLNKQILQIELGFNYVLENHNPLMLDSKKLVKLIEDAMKVRPRHTSFFDYCETYFEETAKVMTPIHRGDIKNCLKKVKEYNPALTFEHIDKRFYRDFTQSLRDQDYSANYIGSIIKNLKVVLNYATENEQNSNLAFRDFKKPSEEVYNVYLNEEEIELIYNLKIDEKLAVKYQDKKHPLNTPESIIKQVQTLDSARKLFVIGCWTGLRVENYLNIDPEMQVDLSAGFLHAIANKNGPKLRIPIHKLVRQIVEVEGFPKSINQQQLNDSIKILGAMAKIKDNVIFTRTKGNGRVEYTKKKYEMMTTHTARRSFASNLISRGIPKQFVMAVTGHKTESSFNKYTAAVQKDIMTSKLADYDVWNGEKPVQKKSQEVQSDNLQAKFLN